METQDVKMEQEAPATPFRDVQVALAAAAEPEAVTEDSAAEQLPK